mmetsp:Transcript_6247/g.18779  ORF Transcript_6247/g.18779 Transcript_6247/m.18779 type:complete len:243 (-) Transcript_6247:271-999(-)
MTSGGTVRTALGVAGGVRGYWCAGSPLAAQAAWWRDSAGFRAWAMPLSREMALPTAGASYRTFASSSSTQSVRLAKRLDHGPTSCLAATLFVRASMPSSLVMSSRKASVPPRRALSTMKYPSLRKRRSNSSGSRSPMARSNRARAAPLAWAAVGEPAVKAEEMDSCFVSSALTRDSMACRSSTTRVCAARTSSSGGSPPVGNSSRTLPHSHSSPLGRGILPSASMEEIPSPSRRTIMYAPSP